MMKNWSQADYEERKQRTKDGVADDEDRRLVKQYEQEGFEESRLTREREAKNAARQAGDGEESPELVDAGGELTARSKVDDWRAFAALVNEKLGDDAPIADPSRADKAELIAAYQNYTKAS